MKRIIFLICFLSALWLGIKLADDPGYVLIAYQHWTVEMPLWLFLIGLILFLLGGYLVLRCWHHVKRIGSYWRFWITKWHEKRAMTKMQQGLLDLLNGRLRLAEKKLLKASWYRPLRLMNYLNAAKAALLQHANVRAQQYFDKALEDDPTASCAIALTKATLAVEQHAWDEALMVLKPLWKMQPNNPQVIQLLKVVYQQLGAWHDLILLLPALKKSPLENRGSIFTLERQVYRGWLETIDTSVEAAWLVIPRYWRRDPELIDVYADKLNQANQGARAEVVIRKHLKKAWHESLMVLYGKLRTDQPGQQLHFMERFLKLYPTDAKLLLCLGELAWQARLWGKAKHYLELSLAHAPCAQAYEKLGKVLELLDDEAGALVMYRQALACQ